MIFEYIGYTLFINVNTFLSFSMQGTYGKMCTMQSEDQEPHEHGTIPRM